MSTSIQPAKKRSEVRKERESTAAKVRNQIGQVGDGQLFVTRSFIGIGTRNAIDLALSRMCKKSEITRVGFGVYVKGPRIPDLPIRDIVAFKMEAFGKKLYEHRVNAAERFRTFINKEVKANPKLIFATDGCTSRLKILAQEVIVKAVSARERNLGEGRLGMIIKGMWHQARSMTEDEVQAVRNTLTAHDFIGVRRFARSFPHWLLEFFFPDLAPAPSS